MSAPFENHEPSAQRGGRCFRRCQRDRILSSVDDQGGNGHALERRDEIEVTKAGPYTLLHATDHAKRGEIVRAGGVCEIAGDAQLEASLSIGVRVALPKS